MADDRLLQCGVRYLDEVGGWVTTTRDELDARVTVHGVSPRVLQPLTLCEGDLVFGRGGFAGRTAGLAIGVALALAGCSSGPGDDPETTAQRFLRALAVNDLDKACLLMADEVPFGVHDLPECKNFLGAVATEPDNQVARYAHATVRSAAVQGDQARVTEADISNVDNPDVGLSLQRIDGRWYVSELG